MKEDNNRAKIDPPDQKIKRIRDILVGKNYDEILGKIEKLEDKLRKHMEVISGEISSQKNEINQTINNFTLPLQEEIKTLLEKFKYLEGQYRKDLHEVNTIIADFISGKEEEYQQLKKQFQGQKEDTFKHIQEKITVLREDIMEELHALKREKINKSLFAAILSEIALNISEENKSNKDTIPHKPDGE